MSTTGPRQPPRFVPTLTDVVVLGQRVEIAPEELSEDLASLAEPEVVVEHHAIPASEALEAPSDGPVDPAQDWNVMAQSMQARVMERIDGVLEERLRYALGELVQMQIQSLYQALRQDIERLVSGSVHEAIAQELAQLRSEAASETAHRQP